MAQPEETTPRVQRFRGVDRTFVAIVAGVFLFNFGLTSAIASRAKTWSDDWTLMEEVISAGRIGSFLPPPPPKPDPKQATNGTEGTKVAATATTRANTGPRRPAASLDHMVKTVGLTSLLGSKGLGNGTDIGDELWSGHEATTLEKAMQEAREQGAGVRLDGGTERRGPEAGAVSTIGDLKTEGGAGDGSKKLADRGPAKPRPRVTFEDEEDPPVSTPGCDRAAIAKVVKRTLSALQACYEYETKKLPTLRGKVVVRFTIGREGRVTDVELDEDTVGSASLRRCIERSFRLWSFPAAPSECEVSHPIVFAPVP